MPSSAADYEPIPLSGPDITEAEVQAATDVVRRTRLSSGNSGPKLSVFEDQCAKAAGRRYGVGVNSGTSGLHLCVKGLGIGRGDEVITTAFTFIATINCVLFEQARPVLVDIDPGSYNMDPAAVEAAITPNTKAILPVEVFGNTAHFDEYERIARKHDLALIEDCCEALGGVLGDRSAGSFGDCGVFAFYPNKQITTGEGGMIVTDDEDLRDLCVSWRNQGRGSSGSWLAHERMGYNYRLSELNAALGVVQMQRLDEILAKRRRAAQYYDQALAELADSGRIVLPPMAERGRASWFVYVVRLADEFDPEARDVVCQTLADRGVGFGVYFAPCHYMPHVQQATGATAGDLPHTERIGARTIALPFFANLSEGEVARTADALAEGLDRIA